MSSSQKDDDANGMVPMMSDCKQNMSSMSSDYNKLSESQSTVWQHARPLFAKAMENASIHKTFHVAELGCATGGNSIQPLSFVSSRLPEDCALEVILGDLPDNSWSTVAQTVMPQSITRDQQHRSPSNTYVCMVGRSFYENCAPPGSLDLSYSLVAVHWMKSHAGDLPSGLYATDPEHVPESALLKAWRDAGATDFLDFTRARHGELKVGGRFIGAVAAPKANGHLPWSRVGLALHRALQSKIAPDVLASCVLPVCWRTEADVRAGFEEGGWELESCEFHETKDPVRAKFELGEMTPTEYGRTVVASFKAVCYPTCVASLARSSTRKEAERLLDAAHEECVETIAADPDQYNLDVSFWYVVAVKTGPVDSK